MSNILNLPGMDDFAIEIPRSAEFMVIAHEVGDFIQSLSLDQKKNDELIRLIVKQVNEAEKTSFREGIKMASELNKVMED
ncbi:hypothetical protein [Acetobacterium sp.]|jgi:hypothetical protein|uniref:hypothetical protein n=1 Tax=Acetobacterium sp. TaxID=1872094 RepID=UPI002719E6E9|nr:hypothetical protein [Acetobacterium sp.]MDO9492486.1 hypothetical protein [Acetobacterium sp.]